METGNIYSQPELPPPTKPEGPPDVELTAEKARAKVKRDIVGFTTAILVVLGIAIWLISAQEQRHREQSPVPATNAPELLSAPLRLPTNPPPVTFKIENTTFSEGPAPTNTPLDPATLARAMGEVRIANQYLRAEELDSAEEHARQALAIWPDLNAGQRLLGLIYTQRGQFDQAIAVFEKARQTDPANPEVLNNMATAFMQKRMMDKAEELLQTALQLDPGFTVAYLNLGLLFLASGRYEAAAD